MVGSGGYLPRYDKVKGDGDDNDGFGVGGGVGGEGGGKRIKWGKRMKWRGGERSGVKTPGGRQARPEER